MQAIHAAIEHQRLLEAESTSKDDEIASLKGHLAQIQVRSACATAGQRDQFCKCA